MFFVHDFSPFCQLKSVHSNCVGNAKAPFGSAKQVVSYLGRYTHRVAISNDRLVALQDGRVSFRWRDYRQGNKIKIMTLEASEFIRRFLLHASPSGLMRIRHYGLVGNRCRTVSLALCRGLLQQPEPPLLPKESAAQLMYRLTGINIERCPHCHHGRLQVM